MIAPNKDTPPTDPLMIELPANASGEQIAAIIAAHCGSDVIPVQIQETTMDTDHPLYAAGPLDGGIHRAVDPDSVAAYLERQQMRDEQRLRSLMVSVGCTAFAIGFLVATVLLMIST